MNENEAEIEVKKPCLYSFESNALIFCVKLHIFK